MKGYREKSIKINMILNSFKGLLSVTFPLITFPYVSRVLGVNGIGEYNFANSVVSYFVLIAGLGISSYAVCSGAGCREDRQKFSHFVNQIFSISMFSAIGAYVLLILSIILIPKFHTYKSLLVILSLPILFKAVGIEWIYSIFEDYFFITIRSIIFQLISLVMLLVLVKNEEDVNIYALITVLASVGASISNFVHARKYCSIRFTLNIKWKKHLKPIMLFFATAVTVTIYVSSDTTILGFICDDYTVGIYSVSVKVYTILKSLLSSAIVVIIPRMCALWVNKCKNDFSKLGNNVYQTFLTVTLPAIVGMILLSEEIVLLLAGVDYIEAKWSMRLLGIALFFCLGAGFWSQAVMIPQGKEAVVFKITVISAISNIVLNMCLIPLLQEKAAALTTVIAEAVVFIYCRQKGIKSVELKGIYRLLGIIIMGCIPMLLIKCGVSFFTENLVLKIVLIILLCILFYVKIEIYLKNHIIINIIDKIYLKFKKYIVH